MKNRFCTVFSLCVFMHFSWSSNRHFILCPDFYAMENFSETLQENPSRQKWRENDDMKCTHNTITFAT